MACLVASTSAAVLLTNELPFAVPARNVIPKCAVDHQLDRSAKYKAIGLFLAIVVFIIGMSLLITCLLYRSCVFE
jgi:hypothetical protein